MIITAAGRSLDTANLPPGDFRLDIAVQNQPLLHAILNGMALWWLQAGGFLPPASHPWTWALHEAGPAVNLALDSVVFP